MEPVDPRIDPAWVPPGSRAKVVNGPDREWKDLPSVITPNGYVITRWELDDDERRRIAAGEDIFVTLVSAGRINPLFVCVGPSDWRKDPQ